ncbi:MAG: RnfABCDGE type electron transport complex subunit B [Oscillospiraceae bacterium]
MDILYPVFIFAAIGVVMGLVLTAVYKLFEVHIDERVAQITEKLPNINCGACGFPGCAEYASHVAAGECAVNLCLAGGEETAESIAELLGVEAGGVNKAKAFIRCGGNGDAAQRKYQFDGYESCAQAARFFGGEKRCKYACLGYGDCAAVCPENAVAVINGVAVVNRHLCMGCGLCATRCPVNIIKVFDISAGDLVRCASHDAGKAVREACANGCIACGLCVKKCPSGAIVITDNLAVIDHDLCTACGLCAKVCPTGAIVRLV